jgi:hypothetical protein
MNNEGGGETVVEPPAEWGQNWCWNVLEDGTGIYMEPR